MKHGFIRVAAASPAVTVADPAFNTAHIITLISQAYDAGAEVLVFPELCVSAYTCADLFHNDTLLKGVADGLREITAATASRPGMLVVVGAPLRKDSALYNCAVAVAAGKPVMVAPKTYIPNYNEFYERRWFAPAPAVPADIALYTTTNGQIVRAPFMAGGIMEFKGVKVAMEICEDLWTTIPPSCTTALAGAEVIVNLSASNDLLGKYDYLNRLVRQQSGRCLSAYVYASSGFGESSTDLVFDAKLIIAENGRRLTRNERWIRGNQLLLADIDIEALRHDRQHNSSFYACSVRNDCLNKIKEIVVEHTGDSRADDNELLRTVDAHPFIPSTEESLAECCEEVLHIQTAALAQRLKASHTDSVTVGISGGLDSTLALLVAVRTFDSLGLDRKNIIGVTMPGFGTTDRTYDNAMILMRTLGITVRQVPIAAAVVQHFNDIGHDVNVHDVTYENSQARERTQILMDIANQSGGMVLGTGDLSELALGWATYNGDHMSMYGVNAGVPKTLVQHLVRYCANNSADSDLRHALIDVVDTPISPELIPAGADGTIEQKTEDLVGPYELHDFFLYYMLRYGFSPRRVYYLACKAFAGAYDGATIKHWLKTFYRRFFTQQFKRSCLPDGPKVGSVSLSPRGDWRMPSDASAALWLKEIDRL